MKIIDIIINKRKGHYCHAIEVSDTYEIESIVEHIISEFEDSHSEDDIIEFFDTMQIYYLGDNQEMETAVYDFNFKEHIQGTI